MLAIFEAAPVGSLAVAAGESAAVGFDLSYLESDGSGLAEVCRPLTVCWSTRFEDVAPAREFPFLCRPAQLPWFGVSRMGVLVGFESWLERDQVMMLDYSPQVRAFSARPFWLTWSPEGKETTCSGLLRPALGWDGSGGRCPGRRPDRTGRRRGVRGDRRGV